MKIQFCSDLHIEFPMNSDYLMNNGITPVGDILILAGDITYLGDLYFKHSFFDYISDNFNLTYWIPGNHEFYDGFDLSVFEKPLFEKIRSNIFLVNNKSFIHDGIELFLTTLWSRLDREKIPYVLNGVNDFFKIKSNGQVIQRKEFEFHHELSKSFLNETVKNSIANIKVIVTHHVPSQICNSEEYKGSWINSAFVVDMDEFILSNKIDYWIYGHHHRNLDEKRIGKTKLITNQLGYVHLGEHMSFQKNYILNL